MSAETEEPVEGPDPRSGGGKLPSQSSHSGKSSKQGVGTQADSGGKWVSTQVRVQMTKCGGLDKSPRSRHRVTGVKISTMGQIYS